MEYKILFPAFSKTLLLLYPNLPVKWIIENTMISFPLPSHPIDIIEIVRMLRG
jgi:hypothetical protein